MNTTDIWYFALGFLGQLLFASRMLIQWIQSEKAKKVLSPTIYWQLSLLGSFIFLIYGWLREDFAIIVGQILSYYIYIWNLNNKNHWETINKALRLIIVLIPILALSYVLLTETDGAEDLFDDIPIWLIIFGSTGQILFATRFIYQWWYSKRRGESLLPFGFWMISLVGSFAIMVYGIFRKDPVLVIGQIGGFFTYSRNLWLLTKQKI